MFLLEINSSKIVIVFALTTKMAVAFAKLVAFILSHTSLWPSHTLYRWTRIWILWSLIYCVMQELAFAFFPVPALVSEPAFVCLSSSSHYLRIWLDRLRRSWIWVCCSTVIEGTSIVPLITSGSKFAWLLETLPCLTRVLTSSEASTASPFSSAPLATMLLLWLLLRHALTSSKSLLHFG